MNNLLALCCFLFKCCYSFCTFYVDLFAEEPQPQSKKKKTVKKKVVKKAPDSKDLSIFDDDAPSIFDDPLSATMS